MLTLNEGTVNISKTIPTPIEELYFIIFSYGNFLKNHRKIYKKY